MFIGLAATTGGTFQRPLRDIRRQVRMRLGGSGASLDKNGPE
jgi:hypothetical protein